MQDDKYYIAPNKRGRLIKIVVDVQVPGQYDKLSVMGCSGQPIVKQALIARFVNAEDCARFLKAYEFFEKYGKYEKLLEGLENKDNIENT
ncbi:MAG: hypothetical protein K6G15_00630 [Desulfovibrio sp.]|nr:hypothetical protein [Desulfovibrio sp.]